MNDTIAAVGTLARNFVSDYNIDKSNSRTKEKEETITVPKQDKGTTYYHVTTPDAAASIMASNFMIGSSWEGYHVYAWKTKPSQYAIANSGAHFGVTISFKTNASFVMDTGISDINVLRYGPVVSLSRGPIMVWDVKIVG